MVYNPMRDVAEFHDKFLKNGKDRDKKITVELLGKRLKLISEEYDEVVYEIDAMSHYLRFPDSYDESAIATIRENLAKELADLLYMVYGTAEELSIPMQEVFKAVHANNMTKLWPDGQVHYNESGKVLKPPGFKHLDLSDVLNEQQH